MVHPSKQNCSLLTAVAEGLGMNQAAVNPVWEPSSYSPDTANINRKTIRTPRAFDAQGGGVRDVSMEVYYFPCSLLAAGPLVCPELDSSCHGHTALWQSRDLAEPPKSVLFVSKGTLFIAAP